MARAQGGVGDVVADVKGKREENGLDNDGVKRLRVEYLNQLAAVDEYDHDGPAVPLSLIHI